MTALVTIALLVLTAALWTAADVWLYYRQGGYHATISCLALRSAQKRPIIAAAVAMILGIIFGHLFWPQELTP